MGTFCRKAAAGGATPREQEPGPPRGDRARTRFELDYWYVMARVETTADDEVASSTSGRARSVVGNTLSVTVAPFAAVAERTRTLAGEATSVSTLMVAALARAAIVTRERRRADGVARRRADGPNAVVESVKP